VYHAGIAMGARGAMRGLSWCGTTSKPTTWWHENFKWHGSASRSACGACVVGEVEQKCPSRHAQGHYAVNQKPRPMNCVYAGFEGPFEVNCKNCGSGPFAVFILGSLFS
jgi:hypothetical protein